MREGEADRSVIDAGHAHSNPATCARRFMTCKREERVRVVGLRPTGGADRLALRVEITDGAAGAYNLPCDKLRVREQEAVINFAARRAYLFIYVAYD